MRRTVVLTILLAYGSVVLFGQNVTLYNTNIVDVEGGKVVPGMTVHVKNGMIARIVKAKKRIKKGQTDYTGDIYEKTSRFNNNGWIWRKQKY